MDTNKNKVNPFSLIGDVALITGGGTGLGFAMAQCFMRAGAKAVIIGRRQEVIEKAVGKLGAGAFGFSADITQFESLPDLVKRAESLAGAPISILVNNAGFHVKKTALETTPEEFESVVRTHLFAAHALSREILPGMIVQGHGNILFMASMTSYLGIPFASAYTAAKSAFMGMVRSLAVEVAEHGIRVNGIAPGWIDTDMLRGAMAGDPKREKKVLNRTPLGRFGEPVDIGQTAVFYCSPAAKFITGTILPVDGGASIGF